MESKEAENLAIKPPTTVKQRQMCHIKMLNDIKERLKSQVTAELSPKVRIVLSIGEFESSHQYVLIRIQHGLRNCPDLG